MSGNHSTYEPTSGLGKWVDSRLPLPRLVHDSFVSYPVPRNLNYAYTFGGILSIMLVVQIITGIVLAMHYAASTELAFNSVEGITRDVNYGWLLRYMHANGASFLFIAVYLHIARGLEIARCRRSRATLVCRQIKSQRPLPAVNAVLVANFQIASGAGSVPTEYRFSRSIPLQSAGYAALVRAEKQLAKELAAAIVAALNSPR